MMQGQKVSTPVGPGVIVNTNTVDKIMWTHWLIKVDGLTDRRLIAAQEREGGLYFHRKEFEDPWNDLME